MATDNSLLSGSTADSHMSKGVVFLHHNSPGYGTIAPSAFSGYQHPSKPSKMARIQKFIYENRGLFIFALAQFFENMISMLARFLATSLPSGQRYHVLHVLFVQMSITLVLCLGWMWRSRVPDMPFGKKGIRWLLVLRGCMGFLGSGGLYYALSYLALPDVTVIGFLVPTVMSFICSVIPSLQEPFTGAEKIGALVSLVGVILIAKPTFLFHSTIFAQLEGAIPLVSSHQRTLAVIASLISVLGTSSAFTTIRVIGKRSHPLMPVAYFASMTTILSFVGILTIPGVGMIFPKDALEWVLLVTIGVSSFVLQFLLTQGLQLVKAGRAGSLVYTQMIWAVTFEWLVWGNMPSMMNIFGGALIIGGAAWVNWQKSKSGSDDEEGSQIRKKSVSRKSMEDEENLGQNEYMEEEVYYQ